MEAQTLAIIAFIINVIVGIVFCFFGNRWLKIIVAVYGFIAGFMLAYTLLPMFTSLSDMLIVLISLGAGVLGALIFVLLIYVGLFFIGFGAGLLLSLLVADVFSLNLLDWYVYVPALVVACILGSLTLNFRRIFVSIFTAYIGASSLAVVVYAIIYNISETMQTALAVFNDQQAMANVYHSPEYLVSLAILFLAGLIVQLTGKGGEKRLKSL